MNLDLRILVVEDDSNDADLMAIELRRQGIEFEARVATGRSQLVQALEDFRPSLVLADFSFPDMNGFDVIQIVEEQAPGTPTIIVTGSLDEETAAACIKNGAIDYVLKQHLARLGPAVRAALDRQRAKDERDRAETARREADERYRIVTETASDAILTIDESSRILFANHAVEAIFGYAPEELLGRSLAELMPGAMGERHRAGLQRYIEEGKRHVSWRAVCFLGRHKSGREIPLEVSFGEHVQDGRHIFTGVVRDVSERVQADAELRKSEERYALAARGANDGLWDWELVPNSLYLSPRWKEMLGYADDEIASAPNDWLDRVHPEDIQLLKAEMFSHIQGTMPHFQSEYRIRHKDGTYRWMLCRGLAVRDAEGRPYRFAGSQTDITERRIAEGKLAHDALYDSLTNLPNRALFMDRLERSLERAKWQLDFRFCVLILDLDRFKNINDSLGHNSGDEFLMAVARRLETCIRPGDTLARVGGDEFAILLEDTETAEPAIRVANRIQKDIAERLHIRGHEVFTTASIGIATSGPRYDTGEEMVRDADTAMYRAKDLGKARFELFDAEMHRRVSARLKLETDLRNAVDGKEFWMQYQPIVHLGSRRLVGFEALVRWKHPIRGMIHPAEFISIAEETGLIVPLGRWVVEEACQQLRRWHLEYPSEPSLLVTVNVSGRQLRHPGLVDEIGATLARAGLEGRHLKLEFTESVLIEDEKQVDAVLGRLKQLDLLLALDDFGTGYSSLSYLHRFPIDTLKIDQRFVARLGTAEKHDDIVRTIVLLARSLEMNVIAEGIETAKQLDRLRELDCEHGQGYFISHPVDEAVAGAMIAGRHELT